jgi:hypothetical protein
VPLLLGMRRRGEERGEVMIEVHLELAWMTFLTTTPTLIEPLLCDKTNGPTNSPLHLLGLFQC